MNRVSMWIACVLLGSIVLCQPSFAQVQRMMVPAGTTVRLVGGKTARTAAMCMDPHLAAPTKRALFRHVAADSDAVLTRPGLPDMPLIKAIGDGLIEVRGSGLALEFRALFDGDGEVVFRTNTVTASESYQANGLADFQAFAGTLDPAASQIDVWNARYLQTLADMRYSQGVEGIQALQADWGLRRTGHVDLSTQSLLDQVQLTREALRRQSPGDGGVLSIIKVGDAGKPLYRVIIAETGEPLRDGGKLFETDSVETVRTRILALVQDNRTEYVRMVRFTEAEAKAFRASLDLGNVKVIGDSLRFFKPGARVIAVSEIAEVGQGVYEATATVRVERASVSLKVRSRVRAAVERVVQRLKEIVGGPKESDSVRTILRQVKQIIHVEEKPVTDFEFVDEFGSSQFVHMQPPSPSRDTNGSHAFAGACLPSADDRALQGAAAPSARPRLRAADGLSLTL